MAKDSDFKLEKTSDKSLKNISGGSDSADKCPKKKKSFIQKLASGFGLQLERCARCNKLFIRSNAIMANSPNALIGNSPYWIYQTHCRRCIKKLEEKNPFLKK